MKPLSIGGDSEANWLAHVRATLRRRGNPAEARACQRTTSLRPRDHSPRRDVAICAAFSAAASASRNPISRLRTSLPGRVQPSRLDAVADADSKNFRIVCCHSHRGNRGLLSAVSVAQEECLRMAASSCADEPRAVRLAAYSSPHGRRPRICCLRGRLRRCRHTVAMDSRWPSADVLGSCRRDSCFQRHGHHHARPAHRVSGCGVWDYSRDMRAVSSTLRSDEIPSTRPTRRAKLCEFDMHTCHACWAWPCVPPRFSTREQLSRTVRKLSW